MAVLVVALAGAAFGAWWERDPLDARLTLKRGAAPSAPTQILVVLDTVRADTTSACGYAHPTTPTLDALAARPDAQLRCGAVTPGDWTLPSHASYFTGVDPLEHGAHGVEGAYQEDISLFARPLDERFETLAERFAERGYQTLSVSGNPVLCDAMGMTRGFDHALWLTFPEAKGSGLTDLLKQGLLELERDAPLFLFLNISDAHLPWPAIRPGHAWLPAQQGFDEADKERWRASQDPAVVDQVRPLYGGAVGLADDTLGASLALLERTGWLGDDARMVITSDHGEVLGEHGMIGHGGQLHEPNNRVVFLTVGPDMPALPDELSAMEAHPVLLHGTLGGFPVHSSAFPMRYFDDDPKDDVALGQWAGTDKWVWQAGGVVRYDLDADPGELSPLPDPDVARFGDGPERALRSFVDSDLDLDPETRAMLQAAGYLDP